MSHFFATRIPLYVLKRRFDAAIFEMMRNPTHFNETQLDVAEEEYKGRLQAMQDNAIALTVDRIRAIGRMNQLAQLVQTANEPASEDEVFGEPI